MAETKPKFELPADIERYLAALSKLYGQEGERQLQQIIVNAQTRVEEEWTYDGIDGGASGHALFLLLPDALYLPIARRKLELENRICEDLNHLHNVSREFFAKVVLEMESAVADDWRNESGLLLKGTRVVSDEATSRIWPKDRFRLFLSHKTEVKAETGALKDRLDRYGISAFVAHADIAPTKEWQDEIENALATMDAFAALLTDGFHDSYWTDQEVGYALARGVPIVAVRLGRDPYGFLGKFQGLTCNWQNAAPAIVKLLVSRDRMLAAYLAVVRECSSFGHANTLAEILPAIQNPSSAQVDALVEAYNSNSELRGSFGFNGKQRAYGPGLIEYLNRWTGRTYSTNAHGMIIRR